jgi:chromosome segregation ATPase
MSDMGENSGSGPFDNRGHAPVLMRLDQAMRSLEAAVEARIEHEAGLAEIEAEVQRMGADRSRLAEALDGAEARAKRLENTNREVSRRLVSAMEAIRVVLEGNAAGAAGMPDDTAEKADPSGR